MFFVGVWRMPSFLSCGVPLRDNGIIVGESVASMAAEEGVAVEDSSGALACV